MLLVSWLRLYQITLTTNNCLIPRVDFNLGGDVAVTVVAADDCYHGSILAYKKPPTTGKVGKKYDA